MHVSTTTRRSGDREYTATLLRRSYRQDGKVKKETLANLSHLPPEAIDAIRRVLAGETLVSLEDAFEIERSLPAGHVNAALAMARRLELPKLLDRSPCRERDLCMAMIVGRVICPGSKLGMVRTLAQSTLASELGVEGADEDDLYAAMDWLVERQDRIEDRLAARHLRMGRWCSMTCPPVTSRGGRVRWRSWGTRVTGSSGFHRSSTGCCATRTGGRSRSRCSLASCTTTRRSRAGHKTQGPVRALAGRRGRGSRDGHEGEHRAAGPGRRGRLDHRVESPDDQETRQIRRLSAVAV